VKVRGQGSGVKIGNLVDGRNLLTGCGKLVMMSRRADGGPGNSFVLSMLLNLIKEYLATEDTKNTELFDGIKKCAETI